MSELAVLDVATADSVFVVLLAFADSLSVVVANTTSGWLIASLLAIGA